MWAACCVALQRIKAPISSIGSTSVRSRGQMTGAEPKQRRSCCDGAAWLTGWLLACLINKALSSTGDRRDAENERWAVTGERVQHGVHKKTKMTSVKNVSPSHQNCHKLKPPPTYWSDLLQDLSSVCHQNDRFDYAGEIYWSSRHVISPVQPDDHFLLFNNSSNILLMYLSS